METLNIGLVEELISREDYLKELKSLIVKSINLDPTLVLHDDKEIIRRYASSVVVLENGRIIGNTSIYTTNMRPLDSIEINGEKVEVGECGSTLIDIEKRYKGLGKNLVNSAIKTLGNRYKVLIAATINPQMEGIRLKQGFENSEFPRQYYEEGLKYLSPKLFGGEEEFKSRARFLIKFNDISCREHILYLLQNQ